MGVPSARDRVVTGADQLNALPLGSIVRGPDGTSYLAWVRAEGETSWTIFGKSDVDAAYDSYELELDAAVLGVLPVFTVLWLNATDEHEPVTPDEEEEEVARLRRALAGHLFDGESMDTREAIRAELIQQGLEASHTLRTIAPILRGGGDPAEVVTASVRELDAHNERSQARLDAQ